MSLVEQVDRPTTWKRTIRLAAAVAGLWSIASMSEMAQSAEGSAHDILKQMSDYLGQVKNLTLDFSSDVEIISHGGQCIVMCSIGQRAQVNIIAGGIVRYYAKSGYCNRVRWCSTNNIYLEGAC